MKLICTDIDGVLTDGRVTLDYKGRERKTISYRDLDAIGIGRRAGFDFAFITGEDTPFVELLSKKFAVNIVYAGAKDKLKAINEVSHRFQIPVNKLLYIGDSDRDAPALEKVGLAIVPADGTPKAKAASHYITTTRGCEGVLHEAVTMLISGELEYPQ